MIDWLRSGKVCLARFTPFFLVNLSYACLVNLQLGQGLTVQVVLTASRRHKGIENIALVKVDGLG